MTVLRSALNVARGQSPRARLVRRALVSALIIAVCLVTGYHASGAMHQVISVVIWTTAFDFGSHVSQQHRARRTATH